MCWTTIITLVLSAFLKKENKILNYLYNILFGCALIGGALTFLYPDCMSSDRPFLHFLNIQTITVHALLIFAPIYLIKIGEFKVEIKNIWKLFVGYVFIGSLAMTTSLISGENFAFATKFDLFDLGLPFPWHLPVVMLVLVALSSAIYGIFELVRFLKYRNKNKEVIEQQKSKLGLAFYITTIATAIVFGMSILLGTSALIGKDVKTLLGLLCLFGLIYMLAWIIVAEYHKKYINSDFDFSNKTKTIIKLILMFIFNLPVGIIYLIAYCKKTPKLTIK